MNFYIYQTMLCARQNFHRTWAVYVLILGEIAASVELFKIQAINFRRCSKHFCACQGLEAWSNAPTVPSALVSMLLRLPKVKFVIVTLGADGCIMLERSIAEDSQAEEMDVDNMVELLKQKIDSVKSAPTCVPSDVTRLQAKGVGTICGRLFLGTAEKVPESELVDTTGAGDAFIGAILYAICTNKPPEQMLPFAAQVAAISCRALGARTGLPHLSDPRLTPFLS